MRLEKYDACRLSSNLKWLNQSFCRIIYLPTFNLSRKGKSQSCVHFLLKYEDDHHPMMVACLIKCISCLNMISLNLLYGSMISSKCLIPVLHLSTKLWNRLSFLCTFIIITFNQLPINHELSHHWVDFHANPKFPSFSSLVPKLWLKNLQVGENGEKKDHKFEPSIDWLYRIIWWVKNKNKILSI